MSKLITDISNPNCFKDILACVFTFFTKGHRSWPKKTKLCGCHSFCRCPLRYLLLSLLLQMATCALSVFVTKLKRGPLSVAPCGVARHLHLVLFSQYTLSHSTLMMSNRNQNIYSAFKQFCLNYLQHIKYYFCSV